MPDQPMTASAAVEQAADTGAAPREQPPQPAATDQAPSDGSDTNVAAGAPPESRWPEILERARAEAREEALAALRAQVGWAEGLDPMQVSRALDTIQRLEADPVGFHSQALASLRADPRYRGVFEPEPEPQPDVKTQDPETGEPIYLFSQKQLQAWLRWRERQAQAPLDELRRELAEVKAHVETVRTREQVDEGLTALLGELRQQKSFADNEAAIFERFNAYPDEWILRHGVGAMLRQAWIDVLTNPEFARRTQESAVERARAKQQASAARPGGGRQGESRPRTPRELAEHLKQKFGS